MSLHLYGFVKAGTKLPDFKGVAGDEIHLEEYGGVAALVSDFSGEAAEGSRENLLSHAHALEALTEQMTVLPMQFGVVFDDAEQLRSRVLEPSHDLLAGLLDRFDGTIEMMVKAFYFEEALYAEIVENNPKIARLRDATKDVPEAASYYDRIALGELVQQALEQKKARDGQAIVAELTPYALQVKEEEPVVQMMAAQASFLVAREKISDFMGAAERLQNRLQSAAKLKVVGPLPPYTFAAGSIPVGSHT
jgi:hypothetical protein